MTTDLYAPAAAPKDAIDAKSATYWTLCYRKRTANHFKRCTDLATTWQDAADFAAVTAVTNPDLEIWYTTTAQADADGFTHAEDRANILTHAGKRVAIRETGSMAELDRLAAEYAAKAAAASAAYEAAWQAYLTGESEVAPEYPAILALGR